MTAKRIMDLVLTIPALIVLLPLLTAIAVWIKCDTTGPVLFRQARVGRGGIIFQILKFRTMTTDGESSSATLTMGADPRITLSGQILRKHKLDELPQLINVLRGEMSIVGPRPEIPEYIRLYDDTDKRLVLSIRPGITDMASIRFIREDDLLAKAEDPQRTYASEILPIKIEYYRDYVRNRSLWLDFVIILRTLKAIFL